MSDRFPWTTLWEPLLETDESAKKVSPGRPSRDRPRLPVHVCADASEAPGRERAVCLFPAVSWELARCLWSHSFLHLHQNARVSLAWETVKMKSSTLTSGL